ncbi:MAG: septal ring lytic transglycosylase RlpA family protein [Moraxellaceae bacterium]|nr:septal ring lytic transglycosylase RlpA family protein [Moraxellaceae bacterium]MDZ4386196.1 septal ring lytic transglycosylase RlpA family protein [Moraxellaceae bacterium]
MHLTHLGSIALLSVVLVACSSHPTKPTPVPKPVISEAEKATVAQTTEPVAEPEVEAESEAVIEERHEPGRFIAEGNASFYGAKFHGRKTASGAIFNKHAMTAAHPSLPFGTRVRVTHVRNGRSVVVTINDRGPFVKTRIIDVSRAAAEQLGMVQQGVARVRLERLP